VLIRGQKVMPDSHLAELYGVAAFRLNEAVKHNAKRFPQSSTVSALLWWHRNHTRLRQAPWNHCRAQRSRAQHVAPKRRIGFHT